MNESRRAHYRGRHSATIAATPRGFTGTFKCSVWGEFKTISKQSAGLHSQQLCLLRRPPRLGCVWGGGKPQSTHQNRQSPAVNCHSKDCQERWGPSTAALNELWQGFFFIFTIIIILGCMLRRGKKPSPINKIQQRTPSLCWVRSTFNSTGVLLLTGTISPREMLAVPCTRSNQLQSRVMLIWRVTVLYHTNTTTYGSKAWLLLTFEQLRRRGHMSDF